MAVRLKTLPTAPGNEKVQVERLEYGKLCVSHTGPIKSNTEEHRQLGWTRDFPAELIACCAPSVIGVSTRESEELPRQCAHGIVLRPVYSSAGVRPVLCRVGKRPEEGEGSEGRRYRLATYLVAPPGSQIEPWQLYQALAQEPLQGITEAEASHLEPLRLEPQAPDLQRWLASSTQQRQAKRFLQEALIYVMSGIPVSLTEYLAAEQFFAWVTALWRLLPPALRPYLSAGWGVGATLAGPLAVTYAAQRANVCAAFTLGKEGQAGIWQPPGEVFDYGQQRGEVFQAEDVIAGVHYAWYLFGCEPYQELPKIETFQEHPLAADWQSPEPDLESSAGRRASVRPAGPLNFQEQQIVSSFNTPGLDARDHYLYGQWRELLNSEPGEARSHLDELDAEFTFPEYRFQAYELGCDALERGQARLCAETFLWRLLESSPPGSFAEAKGRKKDCHNVRLRLLEALHGGSSKKTLEALHNCVERQAVQPLPPEPRARMFQLLSEQLDELDEDSAEYHSFLLSKKSPPDYLAWVKERGFKLALALLQYFAGEELGPHETRPHREFVLNLIDEIAQSPGLAMLLRWADRRPQPLNLADESEVHNLSKEDLKTFQRRLMGEWQKVIAGSANTARLEWLLQWLFLTQLEPEEINDPLLRLAFGGEPQQQEEFKYIAKAVKKQRVPSTLFFAVAQFALKQYYYLADEIEASFEAWAKLLFLWPSEVLAALSPPERWLKRKELLKQASAEYESLIGQPRSEEIEEQAELLVEPAKELVISADKLERLINSWLPKDDFPKIAPWHWRWALKSLHAERNLKTPIVDLCKYFRFGRVPQSTDKHALQAYMANLKEHLPHVQALAKRADVLPQLEIRSQELWHEEDEFLKQSVGLNTLGYPREEASAASAEYLLILLEAFPEVPLEPTLIQLVALARHGRRLAELLQSEQSSPTRRRQFKLATLSPWEVPFPKGSDVVWENAYANTPLWAVFRGVPLEKQPMGALANALRFYRGGDEEKRAEMCRLYLHEYQGGDYTRAVTKVLIEFVIRWLYFHEHVHHKDKIHAELFNRPFAWRNGQFRELVHMIQQHEIDTSGFWQTSIIDSAIETFFQRIKHR